MTESPIQLTPEQQNEWRAKRAKHFKERYDAIVAETGMRYVAVLSMTMNGIVPMLAVTTKKLPKEEPEETIKPEPTAIAEPEQKG